MRALDRKFANLYQALNSNQRQAVDQIEGPVMVIAGPGTGKTQVLTLRIANILKQTDTPPDAILALTFTKSAAHNLRHRLVEIVGSAGYRVAIDTFHGFCNSIIKQYPEQFPRITGATNALIVDQIRLLKKVMDEPLNPKGSGKSQLKLLRPINSPYYYLKPALRAIERIKKENITPAEFAKRLKDLPDSRPKKRSLELVKVYKGYEQALVRERFYDFNDMVLEVIRALRADNSFLLELQERFLYLLADEHQDANQSQNAILELLSSFHTSPNLFIVGDEKQAIFQFQGASLDNFNYFKKLYPEAKLVTLTDNYRSTQTILDAASGLIMAGPSTSLRAGKLNAKSKRKEIPIIARSFATPAQEAAFLASRVKEQISSGVKSREIAVICRDNRDAWPIMEQFEREEVPFVVLSESDLFADTEIRKLVVLLEAIHYYGDDERLLKVLHFDFFNFPPLELWQLLEEKHRTKQSLYDLISKNKRFQNFSTLISGWRRLSFNAHFTDLLDRLVNESGFIKHLLVLPEATEKLDKLNFFFDQVRDLVEQKPRFTLADFIAYIELLREHDIAITRPLAPALRDGVWLLTAHKAKGLEFDYVYIANAVDGRFGGRRDRELFELPLRPEQKQEETESEDAERRLFYVALTRARHAVEVTCARTDRGGSERLPSRFIEEIDPKLVKFVHEGAESKLPKGSEFRPRRRARVPLDDLAFIRRLFVERGLSVSALNNYLACPLNYFYTNLLQVARVQSRHQRYGTAIHSALRDYSERWRQDESPKQSFLLESFQLHLAREPFAEREAEQLLKRGKEALASWWQRNKKISRQIINEFAVRGIELAPNLRLRGQIDKIEYLNSSGAVRVVDYKTGKAKSRRALLGETKLSTGNEYRQLVFYKLLLDKYKGGNFKVKNGIIDFVEGGKTHEFELGESEVKDLEKLIKKTAADIWSGEFLTRGCHLPTCPHCHLWQLSHHQ